MALYLQNILPVIARNILNRIPTTWYEWGIAQVLNHEFVQELARQELDFLNNRPLQIQVRDFNFQFRVLLFNGLFVTAIQKPVEVILSGNSEDFLALMSQQVDPDTLFFQRRLSLSGNTELGLQLKNFLDAIAWEQRLPKIIQLFITIMHRQFNHQYFSR